MNAHTASLINAITLITMGAWGYFGSLTPSPTALIPVFVGVVLMVLNNGIKYDNKVIAHIAVVLTLLILIAMSIIFFKKIDAGTTLPIVRTGLMVATSIFAMIMFIKSFRDARIAREARESS